MIGDRWWRMLNEGVIGMDLEVPGAADFGKYYMAADKGRSISLGEARRSLHSLDWLPWFEDDCLIFTETPSLGADALYVLCRSRTKLPLPDWPIFRLQQHTFKAERLRMLLVTNINGHTARTPCYDVVIVKCAPGELSALGADFLPLLADHIEGYAKTSDAHRQFLSGSFPSDLSSGIWFSLAPPGVSAIKAIEDTAIVLAALSHNATPCHYRVLATPTKPGGSKRIREALQQKPIVCIVGFDRLYAAASSNGNGNGSKPHAHQRCGHTRFLWKQAGLNRLELPREPGPRLRLASQHNVTRVQVHATWVGERDYSDGAANYHIEGGETTLPSLGGPRNDP